MKLYTEEQMRSAMYLSAEGDYDTYSQILNQFTPIELPTDDEIEKEINLLSSDLGRLFFAEGIEWVIEQLKNKYL